MSISATDVVSGFLSDNFAGTGAAHFNNGDVLQKEFGEAAVLDNAPAHTAAIKSDLNLS